MSKADNNWYIQNSIWVAKRDEQARKAAEVFGVDPETSSG